jgi:hypothetical protein
MLVFGGAIIIQVAHEKQMKRNIIEARETCRNIFLKTQQYQNKLKNI